MQFRWGNFPLPQAMLQQTSRIFLKSAYASIQPKHHHYSDCHEEKSFRNTPPVVQPIPTPSSWQPLQWMQTDQLFSKQNKPIHFLIITDDQQLLKLHLHRSLWQSILAERLAHSWSLLNSPQSGDQLRRRYKAQGATRPGLVNAPAEL